MTSQTRGSQLGLRRLRASLNKLFFAPDAAQSLASFSRAFLFVPAFCSIFFILLVFKFAVLLVLL